MFDRERKKFYQNHPYWMQQGFFYGDYGVNKYLNLSFKILFYRW